MPDVPAPMIITSWMAVNTLWVNAAIIKVKSNIIIKIRSLFFFISLLFGLKIDL